MNITQHTIISRNLWPKPEIIKNQEVNTMPMHEKEWGGHDKQWGGHKVVTITKQWVSASAKTTPRSISTATTADRSIVSYETKLTRHKFTKSNHDAAEPTNKV
jgi:hypothetical protein